MCANASSLLELLGMEIRPRSSTIARKLASKTFRLFLLVPSSYRLTQIRTQASAMFRMSSEEGQELTVRHARSLTRYSESHLHSHVLINPQEKMLYRKVSLGKLMCLLDDLIFPSISIYSYRLTLQFSPSCSSRTGDNFLHLLDIPRGQSLLDRLHSYLSSLLPPSVWLPERGDVVCCEAAGAGIDDIPCNGRG